MIDETLAEMQEFGDAPPPSLTEQSVSLNKWVVQKLAGRNTAPTLDDLL
jgi:hypothetical protein